MADAARVFISHSAADADDSKEQVNVRAHDVRVAIRDALKPDYHVLLDEIALQAGDLWRARINLWLRLCDAAVLIISPAALKSHYVAYEANILGYRKAALDPNLRIIPVLVGVRMDEVKASPLNPSTINEWQAPITGDTPAEIAAGVLAGLAGLAPSASRPAHRIAEELEPLLPKAAAQIQNAAAVLDIDDLSWAEQKDTLRLALRLLACGMSDPCAMAIRYFPDDKQGFDVTALERIGELIAAAWVDLKAQEIPKNSRRPDPQPILLNAENPRTAQTYMTAAKHLVFPYLKYVLIEAPHIVPEKKNPAGHDQTMIDKVRAALEGRFGAGDRVKAALERARKFNEAVIVVLHEESLTPGLLPKLQGLFAHVTFFVLGGPEPGRIVGLDDVFVIRPPLGEGDETAFLERYDTFTSDITSL